MKRLLIVSFMLLLAGVVFAGPPAIPPKSLIDVSDNCDQPQYYVLGRVCQSSVDGRLYKGDGNQIIELAAGTSEGDMLGAEYAVGKKIKPSAGGTGLDTSSMTGFPTVSGGTWSVLSVASVKAALGFLTSSDFPVTGVETPTPGMIPKWGESGNTLVDGYVATYFQTALTNPVTGVASPTPGYLTKWGESGNSIVDGLKIGTLTDERWCTYTTADGLKCTETKPAGEGGGISLSDIYTGEITDGALPKYNSDTDTLSEGLKLGTLTNDKWCKYTTEGGLVCASDEPSGGGIAVSDIYLETITDGNLTSYDETSGKLKDAGAVVAYTPPETNAPLCGAGSSAGACINLTDAAIPAVYTDIVDMWGTCSGYLKSDGSCDTPSGGGSDINYTPPESPAPLCSDETGAILACTNLEDVALTELDGAPDDVGVKIITVTGDPEEVIECEGKDRVYIVGANEDYFFQLPDDAAGIRYCFGNGEYGTGISIVPGAGDVIMYGTSTTSSGQGIVSPKTVQDYVCLLGISNSRWRTTDSMGTWTVASVTLPEPEEPPNGDCTTPTGNLLTESFGEGSSLCWTDGPSTCDNTWTVVEGTPAIAAVPEGAPEDTACDNGLHIVRTDASSSLKVNLGDGALAGKDATINFTMYVDSSSIDGWQKSAITSMNDSIYAPFVGGNLDYLVYLYRYASGSGSLNAIELYTTSGSKVLENIAEDTWYNVTIYLDAAGDTDGSSISVGEGAGQSVSFTRGGGGSVMHFGLNGFVADVYIGNVRVSTSGGE